MLKQYIMLFFFSPWFSDRPSSMNSCSTASHAASPSGQGWCAIKMPGVASTWPSNSSMPSSLPWGPGPKGPSRAPVPLWEGLVMLVLTSELVILVILVPEVQSRHSLQEKRGITWKLWMECHLWGAFSWRRVLWLRGSWHCRMCPGHSMCAMRKGSGCQERCPESPVASQGWDPRRSDRRSAQV